MIFQLSFWEIKEENRRLRFVANGLSLWSFDF